MSIKKQHSCILLCKALLLFLIVQMYSSDSNCLQDLNKLNGQAKVIEILSPFLNQTKQQMLSRITVFHQKSKKQLTSLHQILILIIRRE